MRTKLIKFFIVLGVVLITGVLSLSVEAQQTELAFEDDIAIGNHQCVCKRGNCSASNFVSMRYPCGKGGTDSNCARQGGSC